MKSSDNLTRIASFSVNHDYITPGIYVSRVDGDITTYDLRTRKPNEGEYMDNLTMHSVEHMFATFVRNSAIGSKVIYFGPMGCQTGFYLLVRDAENEEIFNTVLNILRDIVAYDGAMPGNRREECGNYKNLDMAAAKAECARYLEALLSAESRFVYPESPN